MGATANASLTPRQARKAQTRAALKQAAWRCLSRSSLAETSIGAITREAKVAHGTFYVHFESKDTLLDALLEDFNAALVERLAPVWAATGPGSLRLLVERTAAVFLDHWAANRAFVRAYAERTEGAAQAANLRDGINPALGRLLAARIEQLAADSGASVPPPGLVAQGLLGLWMRLGLQYLFNDAERDDVVRALVDMSMGAIESVLRPAEGTE